jgi:CheY-like chemotaxis protein
MEDRLPQVTVLIADDLKFFLEIEKSYLVRAGFEVIAVESGEKAVELAVQQQPQLIMLDLEMPGMDGATACAEIRKDAAMAATPIIIMSASGSQKVRARCLKAGCTEFVIKPENPEDLLGIVARVLTVKQRGAERITVVFNVTGSAGEHEVVGRARNLSATGLLLETSTPLKVGASLELKFFLPKTKSSLDLKGEVMRVLKGADETLEIGIRFVDLSQSDQEQLQEYVSS